MKDVLSFVVFVLGVTLPLLFGSVLFVWMLWQRFYVGHMPAVGAGDVIQMVLAGYWIGFIVAKMDD